MSLSLLKLRNKNKKHKGFGLFDLFLWSVAVIAILATVYRMYNSFSTNSKIKQEVENVLFITQTTQSLFSQDSSYDGVNAQNLINTGGISKGLIRQNNIVNAWTSPYNIGAEELNGVQNAAFFIETSKIPKEACVKISNNIRRSAEKITINGTEITQEDSGVKVVNSCNKETDNVLKFTFL